MFALVDEYANENVGIVCLTGTYEAETRFDQISHDRASNNSLLRGQVST